MNAVAADNTATAQGVATTQNTDTAKKTGKTLSVSDVQQQISTLQARIDKEQKKITDLTSQSAKQATIDKEQKKLDSMQARLKKLNDKLAKMQKSAPATQDANKTTTQAAK